MQLQEMFNSVVLESLHDSHVFKAIFFCGAPGAGKSQFEQALGVSSYAHLTRSDIEDVVEKLKVMTSQKEPRVFDVDFTNEKQQEWYDRARPTIEARTNLWSRAHIGLSIHLSGRSFSDVQRIKKELEDKYYTCMMLFVNCNEEIARSKVEMRGRKIDLDYFDKNYDIINQNRKRFENLFGEYYVEVENNVGHSQRPNQESISIAAREINHFLASPISFEAQVLMKGVRRVRSNRPSVSKRGAI